MRAFSGIFTIDFMSPTHFIRASGAHEDGAGAIAYAVVRAH